MIWTSLQQKISWRTNLDGADVSEFSQSKLSNAKFCGQTRIGDRFWVWSVFCDILNNTPILVMEVSLVTPESIELQLHKQTYEIA